MLVPPASQRSEDDYIKRIIGLPGDTVELKDGKVYIHEENGATLALDEPYVPNPSLQNKIFDKVAPGQYFVMGDNRNYSSDSRGGWTIGLGEIVGKALAGYLAASPPWVWRPTMLYHGDDAGMKSVISEIAVTLLIAVALFLGIHYAVQNSEVISGSMIPTLSIGERILINKLAYKFGLCAAERRYHRVRPSGGAGFG